uniref:Uncharacterized protein n=1 Tax=Arundo donax TaxID=35708 RepID=A0A0A8XZM4_ARUDO
MSVGIRTICSEFWGVPDLRDLNICLLGSWIRRYSEDSEKL